jgi:hypothetical protein
VKAILIQIPRRRIHPSLQRIEIEHKTSDESTSKTSCFRLATGKALKLQILQFMKFSKYLTRKVSVAMF